MLQFLILCFYGFGGVCVYYIFSFYFLFIFYFIIITIIFAFFFFLKRERKHGFGWMEGGGEVLRGVRERKPGSEYIV